jgi:electron transfer flavoprotein alpha subunit
VNVLVLAELVGGQVRRTTLSAITAARQVNTLLGGNYSLLLLGEGVQKSAERWTEYGAERILFCDHPKLGDYLAENYTPTVAGVAAEFGLVLATASSFGKDLVPRVAARLGAAYASDCSSLSVKDGRLLFERPMYAGNLLAWGRLKTPIQTMTVRQTEFPPAEASANRAPTPLTSVPFLPGSDAAERIELLSFAEVTRDRPELTEARRVVTGGRPLKERFFEILGPLADELGAALGATRAVCDGGHVPGAFQVGQTGKIVAPELYLAVGVSGALQHVAGMRNSRVIVAINRDREAPIFQVADYGLVANLFEAVPELTRAIAERKQRA